MQDRLENTIWRVEDTQKKMRNDDLADGTHLEGWNYYKFENRTGDVHNDERKIMSEIERLQTKQETVNFKWKIRKRSLTG